MAQDLESIAKRVKQDHAVKSESSNDTKEKDFEVYDDSFGPEKEQLSESDTGDFSYGEDESEIGEFEQNASASEIEGYDDEEDDEEAVIMDAPSEERSTSFSARNDDDEEDDEELEDLSGESVNSFIEDSDFEITDEEIQEVLHDIPEEEIGDLYDIIRKETFDYRKKLMLQMPEDEATAAAQMKMKKIGDEYNIRYLRDHPQNLTIMVNKQDAEQLEFTQEEREKMAKTKLIKLEIVESKNLNRMKVKKIDKKTRKMDVIQHIPTHLSHYSVPLPLADDYCKFKGSQMFQLVQAVNYDDSTLYESTNMKASLIYDQLISGINVYHTDPKTGKILPYKDFLSKFAFHDLDMALYGILVASSMEEVDAEEVCEDCGRRFQYKYNVKTLLTTKGLSDKIKERMDEILEHKADPEGLKAMHEKNSETHIVESPITHNRYYLNPPSIARALEIFRRIANADGVIVYLTTIALFFDKVYMYDSIEDDYLLIEEEEVAEVFDFLQKLPQEELDLLSKYTAQEFFYKPQFEIRATCPHCGSELVKEIKIENMIFRRARDSSTQTQL